MSERRIDVFFYGLFMDVAILRADGVAEPEDPRRAFVDDFELRIGQRATLVPVAGSRTYGMLFALTHTELDLLYAAPGLEAYRAEAIVAQSFDGIVTPALCYNLRHPPSADEWNSGYASRLREILARLNFPEGMLLLSRNAGPNPAVNWTRRFMASTWRASARRAGYLTR
jgi:hypothetical protein